MEGRAATFAGLELAPAFSEIAAEFGGGRVLWSACVAIAAVLVGRGLSWAVLTSLQRWSRSTETRVDDVVLQYMAQPMRWLFPLLLLSAALPFSTFGDAVRSVLRQVLVVAITINVGWIFFRAVDILQELVKMRFAAEGNNSLKARSEYTQMQGFRNIAGFLIVVITLGVALLSFGGVRQLGASLLASAGVAGIVIGFAAQKSLATIVSGLVIAVSQPVRISDVVVVEGEFGTVEEITLTYVVVRVWDLRRLVIPINYFLERPFQNWSRSSTELMATVLLYVDYSASVGAMRQELERILNASQNWNRNTWALQVTNATDRSIEIRALMSASDAPTAWNLRCEVREKLVEFMQKCDPAALPRVRTEVPSNQGESDVPRSAVALS